MNTIKIIEEKENELTIYVSGKNNIIIDSNLIIDGNEIVWFEEYHDQSMEIEKITNININNLEYRKHSFNDDFTNLREYVTYISPLLENLQEGHYKITDTTVVPLNITGNFFANYDKNIFGIDDSHYSKRLFNIQGIQNKDNYDQKTIENYIERYKNSSKRPRSIVAKLEYNAIEGIVLDGHHKICASAALGELAPVILIERLDKQEKDNYTKTTERVHFNILPDNYKDIKNKYISFDEYSKFFMNYRDNISSEPYIMMENLLNNYFNKTLIEDEAIKLFNTCGDGDIKIMLVKMLYNYKSDTVFNFFIDLLNDSAYIEIANSYIENYNN